MTTRWDGEDAPLSAGPRCNWCFGLLTEPVRDPEAVSWLGRGAPTWCSTKCQNARYEAEINAAGNTS